MFDLLQFLAEKRDSITTRDELISRVWKGRIVSDSAISVRINAARKVVGDTGSRQAVIKTIPRRGFRLAVGVTEVEQDIKPSGGVSHQPDQRALGSKPLIGIFPFQALNEELPSYLVRGIAEDIATELSRFHAIEVLSPYSTFRHDFNKLDRLEVARSLGISHMVTGSLKGDTSVQRANVALLDSATGNTLWAERYNVQGEDIFAAQDDAVYQIVSALAQGLTTHQSVLLRRKPTTSFSAYECVLRGLQIYKWGVSAREEAEQSMFWFNRAIELDPEYARARAWRECAAACFWTSPPAEEEIHNAAHRMQQAISLDENDHEIHRLKGALHMCSGDHELGEYHLAKSVELNPNDAHILLKIGTYRSFLANNTDDLTYVDTAFARNPLHPSWYWQDRGITLFAHSEYEESITNLQRSGGMNEIVYLYLAASHSSSRSTSRGERAHCEATSDVP